ncbi:hypothetical protein DFP72DRAFT_1152898 [Ephemerocybe angulata]|uniref:Uncharacterized protein n=1 Tax=Ephemerocybe angulata TaxID=980116 RepID=A0A8H6HGW3_9AGAR|nr:hypothetical protein DFP72DRAFT_1152898 [Tulosesus angulatus]
MEDTILSTFCAASELRTSVMRPGAPPILLHCVEIVESRLAGPMRETQIASSANFGEDQLSMAADPKIVMNSKTETAIDKDLLAILPRSVFPTTGPVHVRQLRMGNTQKTELEHPACPTLRRGKVSDAWAGLVELGDPQLSTAKRQQRTQVYNSTISHANLERQLLARKGGARGEREAYDEAKRKSDSELRSLHTHSQKAQLLEDELSQAQQIADERSRILANLQAEYDELSERNDRLLQSVSEQENMGIVCQELQKQATYLRNLESTNATQS